MLKYLSSKCNNSFTNMTYIIILIGLFLLLIASGILFNNCNHIKKELESCRSMSQTGDNTVGASTRRYE